jgi:hypothetical protein
MIIIGVDFHPEFPQIAWVDIDSGEFQEQRLQHREEAERFYRELCSPQQKMLAYPAKRSCCQIVKSSCPSQWLRGTRCHDR